MANDKLYSRVFPVYDRAAELVNKAQSAEKEILDLVNQHIDHE